MSLSKLKGKIGFCFLFYLIFQLLNLQPVFAGVTEVEAEPQGLNKTEETDGSSGEVIGEDTPSLLDQIGGWFSDFGDKAAVVLEIIVDTSQNLWEDGNSFLNNAWDTTVDAFWNTMEWFEENKWAQTIVAGLLGAVIVIGVIVIAIFAGIPIAIGAGAIALIIGGAIGAGFLYQWLAGDDYSFFGALTSSILGGALGFGAFIGSSSGAFAAAFTWVRGTAVPAAMNWGRVVALPWARGVLRSTGRVIASGWRAAVGWIKGVGRATGRWITTKALPWISSKFSLIVSGAVFGAVTGLLSNFIGVFFLGEEFSIKSLFIDIAIGAFSGGLLAAFLAGGVISTQILIGITAYGGLENWVSTGIKDGDWGWENFIIGGIIAFSSLKIFGPLLERVFGDEIKESVIGTTIETIGSKGVEGVIEELKDLLPTNNKTVPELTPEPKVTPEPEFTPDPKVTPEPELTPDPKVTPEPELTPEPKVTPESEITPDLKVTPDPKLDMMPDGDLHKRLRPFPSR